MKIALGADHGGFQLKNEVLNYLKSKGYETVDFGTNSTASVDYPDFAKKVGEAVVSGQCDFGVLVCTTGIGISMAANKIKGVRAALCHNEDCAKFSRLHNNANIICMGQKYIGKELAERMVQTFLDTQFEGGRHQRRVDLFS